MINPKVSVIMPVFNTVSYVEEAVNSILSQTFRELEVIIINDGSTDGSETILNEVSNRDNRITLINKKNEGSAIARSLGLKMAKGDYLYFMDSDDILESCALERCYERALESNLDILIFDAVSFSEDKNFRAEGFDYCKKGHVGSGVYDGVEIIDYLLSKDLFRVPPWIHFVKRDLVIENGIDFYPGIINEDELFFSQIYFFAKRVGYIPEDFFRRRLRPNSTMTTKFSMKRVISYFTIIEELDRSRVTGEHRLNRVIDKLINNIINGVSYQAGSLKLSERAVVLRFIITKGLLRSLKTKNLFVLLFPFFISLKRALYKPIKAIINN